MGGTLQNFVHPIITHTMPLALLQGKGVMTTYWLNNKEGFNRPLPTADMAASLSQHEFK